MEHIANESTKDKVKVIMGAMKIAKVKPDLLIHDDACHFEQHIKKSKALKKVFKPIRHYVDEFHRVNHKCYPKNNENRGKAVKAGSNQHVWCVQRLGAEEGFRIEFHESIGSSIWGRRNNQILEGQFDGDAGLHHPKIYYMHP